MRNKLIVVGLTIIIITVGLHYWNYNPKESEIENETSKNEEVENSIIVEDDNKYIRNNSETSITCDNANKSIIDETIEAKNGEDRIIDSERSNNAKDSIINNKDTTNEEDEKIPELANHNESEPKEEHQPSELTKENNSQKETEKVEINLSPKEIEDSIIEKYTSLFTNLKMEYEEKLSNLIVKAKNEYSSLAVEERSKQKVQLIFKYLKLGSSLESECDEKFYSLLEQMEAELKAHDLKKDSAIAAEKLYKLEKSTRQKQILEKALKNS